MRFCISILILALFSLPVAAQKNKPIFTYYDSDGRKTSDESKKVIFSRLSYVNDTAWKLDVYYTNGPLINTITFSDQTAKNRHGMVNTYYPTGFMEASGNYRNNKQDGNWLYCNEAGHYIFQRTFVDGVQTDSIDFIKVRDSVKIADSIKALTDTGKVFTRVERESYFKGGQKGWANYLTANLRYHRDAIRSNVQGEVRVVFIVDKEGKVNSARIMKSRHYLLDDEALRLVERSPKWIPAEQDGRIVKSYKLQPVIFRLE